MRGGFFCITGGEKTLSTPEEKKPQQKQDGTFEKAPNWITDMYDKMNVPVKALDALLIILGALIVFLFVFGNKIQMGL